jgi:hypothetical protein
MVPDAASPEFTQIVESNPKKFELHRPVSDTNNKLP